MKRETLIWFSLIIIGFSSCEESKNINIESIVDTKWKLTHIVDKSGEISTFPLDIDSFEIVFMKNGKLDLINLCNISYGEYSISDNDSLTFYNLGPGTEMYCSPDKLMDWEPIYIYCLQLAEQFSISNNNLTINCKDYQLLFNFLSAS